MPDRAGNMSAVVPSRSSQGQMVETLEEYGQNVVEMASQAKDFVSDKISIVTNKVEGLRDVDVRELTENARDVARRNPGKTLLIAAGVGFALGLLLRASR